MQQSISSQSAANRAPPVLVVDDSRDSANMLGLLLRHWGYHALIAYDGTQALELLRAEWPAVALVDINMPLMSGVELARRLRRWAQGRPLSIYALTANDSLLDGMQTCDFDACLLKPTCPALLGRYVEQDCSKAIEFAAMN